MMSSDLPARRYAGLETLSQELAAQIAASLTAAIDARGLASLVVSGGRSPVRLFEILRAQAIDWDRVCIALADERWVDPQDAASNERLVRDVLLKDHAAVARFLGLKNGAPSPDLGAVSAWETFARVPRPFDAVVLGMGDDGHTLSLFPGMPIVHEEKAWAKSFWLPAQDMSRITLTKTIVNKSAAVAFLTAGPAKAHALKEVLEGAYNPDLYPSQEIKPSGELHWFVDEAAAASLSSSKKTVG